MYCEKCGQELPDDSAFCPGCGTRVEEDVVRNEIRENLQRKRRRWILPAELIGLAALVGAVIFFVNINSDKSALKAYQKFYQEYYEENAGDLKVEELDEFDCPGRIITGPDGELLMTIMDVTRASKTSGGKGSLYLYGYEWGRVVQKAELRNLKVRDEEDLGEIPVRALTVDHELYLVGADAFTNQTYQKEEDEEKPFTLYILDEESKEFDEVRWQEKPGTRESEGFYQFETENGIAYERWNYLSGRCLAGKVPDSDYNIVRKESLLDSAKIGALFSVTGDDFEYLLEEMQEEKFKDDTELQLFYGKMMEELDIEIPGYEYEETDAPIVTIAETENGYYGIRMSGKASLLRAKNAKELTDTSKVLKEAVGRKVTRIEAGAFYNCRKLKTADIPENIHYIGAGAFAACPKLNTVMIAEGVEQIGAEAFVKCDNLKQLEIPDSVEKIGKNILTSSEYEIAPAVVFCNPGTEGQEYVEENEIYYINDTIKDADPAEVEQKQSEIEKKNIYLKAYAEYFEENEEYLEEFRDMYDGESVGLAKYDIIDIQKDGIPELVLCIGNSYAGISDFLYVGKNGKIKEYEDLYNWMYFEQDTGLILSSTDGGHMVYSEGIFQYDDAADSFKQIHSGRYNTPLSSDAKISGAEWDGVPYSSGEEYNAKVKEFFNKDAAEYPEYKEYTYDVDLMEEIYNFSFENE